MLLCLSRPYALASGKCARSISLAFLIYLNGFAVSADMHSRSAANGTARRMKIPESAIPTAIKSPSPMKPSKSANPKSSPLSAFRVGNGEGAAASGYFLGSGFRGLWDGFRRVVNDIAESPRYDVYFPFLAWHNRAMWDKKRIAEDNEFAYGFGFGKSVRDERGNSYSLAAMGFSDSNKDFQPFVGYVYKKSWKPFAKLDFRVGLGFTVGLTARKRYDGKKHNYRYPIPLALPVAGVEYKNLAVEAVYIPGRRNSENVLFVWSRLSLVRW